LLYLAAAVYLAVVLLLAKSLGALMIAAALSPVMLLLGIRVQLVVAAAIAAFVLLYPAMRSAGMSPFGPVVSAVASVSPGRAASFDFRLEQEEVLSVHAMQKPVFGWGGYSRALSVPEDVKHASVRDGAWLIRLGESGWAGYVGLFGLLGAPLLLLALRATRVRPSAATSALAVILAANLLDLIPNSGLTVVTMVIAGALIGRLEHASVRAPAAAQARVAAPRLCEPVARARPRLPDMATEGHGLQPDGAAPVVPGAVSARAPDAIEAARPRPGGRYSRFPVRPRPDRLV
jgi:hypothetical protein